ncbi:hypothetical protein MSAN_00295300 [Mycena sanguinolenta]|uniref:Protein kinase domain-containing protein n=1 Tax=Mycena sanguinolenta TaxID=230812 RepID=A0A8H7DG33_9AGAR|nr:hypothetical protein MSAN_00295300 [Mycena sanguinolenta]
MFYGPRQGKKARIVKISGGTGGNGGEGGVYSGSGGPAHTHVPSAARLLTNNSAAARTVKNINNNYSAPSTAPSQFRAISMGDIDLQREIQVNPSGVVTLRRLYSAKMDRGGSDVTRTVAVYQGDGADEEWQRDIAKYMAVRHVGHVAHPNIVQLYGTASYNNIHAAVFHDDLIPIQHFLCLYKHSHLSTVYLYAFICIEFEIIHQYFWTTFRRYLSMSDCTFFIRHSNGRFCVDLVPVDYTIFHWYSSSFELSSQRGLGFLAENNSEATIINSLAVHQYHKLCYMRFSVTRNIWIHSSVALNLGSVVTSCALGRKTEEIAWLADAHLSVHCDANHIFSSLKVTNNYEDYVVLDQIHYTLSISTSAQPTPGGFLFLCPPSYFQTGKYSFRWPDCPAYWSFDPFGADRLTMEDAINCGFPTLRFFTRAQGCSWGSGVYAGLRKFHEAKGFDPDSQDVARHLSHDLYQLSIQRHIRCAHLDDKDSKNAGDRHDTSQDYTSSSEESDSAFGSTLFDPSDDEDTSEYSTDSKSADVPQLTLDTFLAEIPASRTFKLVMNVQLSLILLLAVGWVL